MSSPSSRAFCQWASRSGKTLDVGSRNINGTLRDVMPISIGIDMIKGPGVDVVMNAEAMTFEDGEFDVVVSDNALEHTPHWDLFLSECWRVLKTGGSFAITAAAPTKGRHGYPDDYWRFTKAHWLQMFADQDIDKYHQEQVWNGVRGVKLTDSLDLSITPLVMGKKFAE